MDTAAAKPEERKPRIAFVLPHSTHYTQGLFEILATKVDADFFFFSDGRDWYWEHRNGSSGGEFRHQYLRGVRLGNTRIAPSLPFRLLHGNYDAIVAGIDGRFALPTAFACARVKRIPFVLWTGIWNRIRSPFHRAILPITRHVYRSSDAVVVYGAHVRRYLRSEGVKSERVFIAPHAVDNARSARAVSDQEIEILRQRINVNKSAAILLFVGRLVAVKGVSYLLEAMANMRDQDAILVIVGEGGEGEELKAKAAQLGLASRVRFVGHVAPAETPVFYAAARVLVVPSVTTPREKETWGLVVNEALNQGLPVIASDAVGAAAGGLVRDGVNGFVVPEKDPKALAGAIGRLLDDGALAQKMCEAARRTIADWDHERMADGFVRSLEHVLPQKTFSADRWAKPMRVRANEPS